MTDETNKKKNDDIEFKLKKKKTVSFEIIITTNEKKMIIIKKILIENNNFYMFEIFDVKNSIKQASAKYYFNNTILFLSFFETLTFDVKIFLK